MRTLVATKNPYALALGALLVAACQTDPTSPPSQGTLNVRVSTDLAIPKDVDTLTFVVQREKEHLRQVNLPLGPNQASLPQAFPVSASLPAGTRVHIAATAYQRNKPVVLAKADVVFPMGQSRRVALALSFLCLGSKSIAGISSDGSPKSACGEGQTCRGGACVSSTIEEGDLPPSTEGPIQGTLSPGAPCFDPVACFSNLPVSPIDTATCSVPLGSQGTTPTMPADLRAQRARPTVVICRTHIWIPAPVRGPYLEPSQA